jgi:hypothetical protein
MSLPIENQKPSPAVPVGLVIGMAFGLWAAMVVVAVWTGLLEAIAPPLLAPLIIAGILVPTLVYFRSRPVRAYVERIGLFGLTAFHVWRIPAAGVFFWYGAHDLLPPTFVRHAAWGDLLAGVLAGLIILTKPSRTKYIAFHVIGFADFVLAVGTGLTFTLLQDPRMDAIRTLPLALIPLFGVGISGASHLIAFDLLRQGRSRATHQDARPILGSGRDAAGVEN